MKTLTCHELGMIHGGADGGASFAHDVGRVLGFIFTVVTNYRHDAPSTSLAIAAGTWEAT